MGVDQFVPVVPISDVQEGRSEDADVVLVDGVVQDQFVVDQFFDELGLLGLAVVLVDRNLVRLNEVEKLALNFRPESLLRWIGAEAFVVHLTRRPLLLLAHLTNSKYSYKTPQKTGHNHSLLTVLAAALTFLFLLLDEVLFHFLHCSSQNVFSLFQLGVSCKKQIVGVQEMHSLFRVLRRSRAYLFQILVVLYFLPRHPHLLPRSRLNIGIDCSDGL